MPQSVAHLLGNVTTITKIKIKYCKKLLNKKYIKINPYYYKIKILKNIIKIIKLKKLFET